MSVFWDNKYVFEVRNDSPQLPSNLPHHNIWTRVVLVLMLNLLHDVTPATYLNL